MKIAVPKERLPNETRVGLIPDGCAKLIKSGLEVVIEAGAGEASGHSDAAYEKVGAKIEPDVRKLFSEADLLLKLNPPCENEALGGHEVDALREGAAVLAFMDPLMDHELVNRMNGRKLTAFSVELIPRISRAQSMDALSSMFNLAGYKAVIEAAAHCPKIFPLMMTAGGTISPARVLIIGVGVAGLQAIATAKRLGAVTSGYDIRPAVREQVESLGAKFVELNIDAGDAEDKGGYAKAMSEEFYRKQQEALGNVLAEQDVVITTASVPGKKAPILVTEAMLNKMHPGAVIVDLAAERGGNCAATKCGEVVNHNGVIVLGPERFPATVPVHASQMYSRNMQTLLLHLTKEGKLVMDLNEEITAGCLVCTGGEIRHEKVREVMSLSPLAPVEKKSETGEGAAGSAPAPEAKERSQG